MIELRKFLNYFLLYAGGVFLTATSFIFGAAPLSATYFKVGRGLYWITWLGVASLLFGLGQKIPALFLVLMISIVGVFYELRRLEMSLASAGGLVVSFFGSIVIAMVSFFSYKEFGANWPQALFEKIQSYLQTNLPQYLTKDDIVSVSELTKQLPSAFIIMLILSLFVAVLIEMGSFKLESAMQFKRTENLRNFKVPDFVVWIFIPSLLAAFIKTQITAINFFGLNILYVLMSVYFLQGLAVVATYFKITKASSWWRSICYFLLSTQLVWLTSVLGVLDYWIDFRAKMLRKLANTKESWKNQI